MQLLSQKETKSKLRKEHDELIDTSVRLNTIVREKHRELNTLKRHYDPDKLQAKADFDAFCRDIQEKKSRLLQELAQIEKEIEAKKDIYFGLVAKQDALEERIYAANEREAKLNLRENFINELERKQNIYV